VNVPWHLHEPRLEEVMAEEGIPTAAPSGWLRQTSSPIGRRSPRIIEQACICAQFRPHAANGRSKNGRPSRMNMTVSEFAWRLVAIAWQGPIPANPPLAWRASRRNEGAGRPRRRHAGLRSRMLPPPQGTWPCGSAL